MSGHAGRVPAGCRFWQDAASTAFATSAADHSLCAIGVYTHHLQPSPAQQTDLIDTLRIFGELSYVRAEDIVTIPVLQSEPQFILYSPLADSPLPPNVVLLFVNPDQTLILSEATQQLENQNPPAMGRPACAVIPQVVNTGRAALSLGCCGARAYLDVLTDSVAIFFNSRSQARSLRRTYRSPGQRECRAFEVSPNSAPRCGCRRDAND